MKDKFIAAIQERRKIKLTFFSKDDRGYITRVCAPLDYGPSKRSKIPVNKFHLWDYESDKRQHPLSIEQRQIKELDVLDEKFDPVSFITWDVKQSPWFVKRDWGAYS